MYFISLGNEWVLYNSCKPEQSLWLALEKVVKWRQGRGSRKGGDDTCFSSPWHLACVWSRFECLGKYHTHIRTHCLVPSAGRMASYGSQGVPTFLYMSPFASNKLVWPVWFSVCKRWGRPGTVISHDPLENKCQSWTPIRASPRSFQGIHLSRTGKPRLTGCI